MLNNSYDHLPGFRHTLSPPLFWSSLNCLRICWKQGPPGEHRELCSMWCGSLDGRGVRGKMDTCMYGWVPLLSTRNYHIYFCFTDDTKAFDCVDHNKMWEILQEMGLPDHLTCFPRNQYAGLEATVRPGHGTTDRFQTGKGVRQGCILSPCLFNLYAEYIMWNAGLDAAQAGIKTARRNINNLRYADDTTFMAESEEELRSLLMKVKNSTFKK